MATKTKEKKKQIETTTLYNIKGVTRKQLSIIQEALEMYSRHLAGQFNYSLFPPTMEYVLHKKGLSKWSMMGEVGLLKKRIFGDLHTDESYGIQHPQLMPEADIAYEMYKMILYQFHQEYQRTTEERHISVHDGPPLKISRDPLIKIEEDGEYQYTKPEKVVKYEKTNKTLGVGSQQFQVGFRYDHYCQGWEEEYCERLVYADSFKDAIEKIKIDFKNARDFKDLTVR